MIELSSSLRYSKDLKELLPLPSSQSLNRILSTEKARLIVPYWQTEEGALAQWTLGAIKSLVVFIDNLSHSIAYEASMAMQRTVGWGYTSIRANIWGGNVFKLNMLNEIEKQVRNHGSLSRIVGSVAAAEKKYLEVSSDMAGTDTEAAIMPQFFEQVKKTALHGLRALDIFRLTERVFECI
jgi:hypothetical protein